MAAAVDGANDSVQVPDDLALRLNANWSIEFWARQNTFTNTKPGIIYKGDPTSHHGYVIWENASGGLFFKRENKEAGSGVGALTSAFRHFVVTWDGTNVRWYVNSSLWSTKKLGFPANNGATALQLGKAEEYGNNDLDEVAMYATALSAARIAAHYAAGS